MRSLGSLDQHRDGAVGLRARRGEETVGDLALHHHTPGRDPGQPVEALDHDRRGDVVGEVRDQLVRRGNERRGVEASASPQWSVVLRDPGEVRLERAIELDRVDVGDTVGEDSG